MGKIDDLTGKRYGMLTVKCRGEDRYGRTGRRFITWVCVCDCGNEITVDANNLRTGNTKSCWHGTKKTDISAKKSNDSGYKNNGLKDITGQRFGKLVAIEPCGRTKSGVVKWRCKCDCGNYTEVSGTSLRTGVTKSCGCGVIDGLRVGWERPTHKQSKTRLYNIWCGMKNRTSEKADPRHKRDYFDRGIRICEEWEHCYEAFMDWALANGYKEGLTIDRIDNDGDYCPENCRWVPLAEQANNTRRNRNYTFNGKTQNITQWAKELNVSEDMLRGRLVVLGWDVEKALLTPSKKRGWSNEQRQLSRLCRDVRSR